VAGGWLFGIILLRRGTLGEKRGRAPETAGWREIEAEVGGRGSEAGGGQSVPIKRFLGQQSVKGAAAVWVG